MVANGAAASSTASRPPAPLGTLHDLHPRSAEELRAVDSFGARKHRIGVAVGAASLTAVLFGHRPDGSPIAGVSREVAVP